MPLQNWIMEADHGPLLPTIQTPSPSAFHGCRTERQCAGTIKDNVLGDDTADAIPVPTSVPPGSRRARSPLLTRCRRYAPSVAGPHRRFHHPGAALT